MQTNNLTLPPKGQEEINLVIDLDYDVARSEFQDCFTNIHHGGNRSYNIYEYVEYGNLPDTVNFTSDFYDLTKVTHREARNALWKHYEDSCSDKWKKLHPKRERMRDFIESYNYSWVRGFDWKEPLIDTLDQDFTVKEAANDEIDLIQYCENYKEKYHVYASNGSSQGDYALVVVNIEEFEKMSGREFDEDSKNALQETINNYLWNVPVYARLEFGEEEVHLTEYLSDEYRYDKDEIIERVKEDKDSEYPDYVIEFLEENLPEDLD